MDKPTIGIRQADGSFYEIMDDAHGARKRLVLSAARAGQHGARIDLYRSPDGTIDNASPLGTLTLDDPDGLGFQDIEFHVDLDDDGQLEASVALPGQPPRTLSVDLTPFRNVRSDASILSDPSLEDSDLDTLDFPDVETDTLSDPIRSDADILADPTLDDSDLDTLPDLETLEDAEFGTEPLEDGLEPLELDAEPMEIDAEPLGLDDFALDDEAEPLTPYVPDLAGDTALAAESFDLADLDAGFGTEPTPAAGDPVGEDWEKISLDDLESMEFMDTGDEISAPASRPPAADADPFRMDDDQPLELGDLDSDLSDLPELDDGGPTTSKAARVTHDDFDQDFVGLEELEDPAPWEPTPIPSAPEKSAKEPKAAKAPKGPRPSNRDEESLPGGLDRTALFLSLSALSLLVLLILVLLFLNMVKAPQPPVIQPEVQRWKPVAGLVRSAVRPSAIDLDSSEVPTFRATTVLEVPEALRASQVGLTLAPGDTVADATRRFGSPARIEGNLLSW